MEDGERRVGLANGDEFLRSLWVQDGKRRHF